MRISIVAGMRIFALSVALSPSVSWGAGCAEIEPYYWHGDRRLNIYDDILPLMTCRRYPTADEQAMADATACNWFAGRALQAAFAISDFTPEGRGWTTANGIAIHVANSPNWRLLGKATDQATLTAAARAASDGSAVLAVASGNPHGHVAIILAGPLSASGSWNLRVPNSASFFLHRPASSYVGCKLSYAFEAPDGVKIYRRM